MPLWYDPKSLTDSLELDYFDRPRPLGRWWRRGLWLAGAAALVCVAWVLWPTHHAALEAGPVSAPHAMFNEDCARCHTAGFATAARLFPAAHPAASTPDQSCIQCHPGPDHNRFVRADNCSSCHKEHRGHLLLARPGDGHCTSCHGDLKEKYGSACKFENVSSLGNHPEFALWRGKQAVDPGNVEFNHQKHLQLRSANKLAAIGPAVARLEQMQCAFCHQPDTAGKYMQPIQFDKHCQECHPLLIRADDGRLPAALKETLQAFQKEPVGHPQKGQTALEVRAVVRERLLQFAQKNAAALDLKVAPMEEWLVLPGLARPAQPATKPQLAWVNEQWHTAEKLLFDKSAGCALCHTEVSKKEARVDGLPDFGQPRIPQRWLAHGVFDHSAHRMLDCTACHEGAPTSSQRKDVLMPKMASCQSCHQPKAGFARADCVECHAFHQRAGAPAWHGKMTIQGAGR